MNKITKLMLWGCALPAFAAYAQDDENDEIFELSPFTVDSSQDSGYRAMNTLSGSRLNTSLKDTAAPISVFTKELIEDLGVTSFEELADWSIGSEVYFNEDEGNQNEMLFAGGANLKVRGLAASRGRNYYEWNLSSDNYNAERLELSSGPNAILFGLGSPGGIFNTSTKRARTHKDFLTLSNRIGSYGMMRNSVDANKVLLQDKLAIRINLLREERESWRDWEYKDTERNHIALTWKVREGSTFRAEWEDGNFDSVGVRTYSTVNNYQTLAQYRPLVLPDNYNPMDDLYDPVTNPYGLYDPYPESRLNHKNKNQRVNQALNDNANIAKRNRNNELTIQRRGRRIVYVHPDDVNSEPFLYDAAGYVTSRRAPNGLISVHENSYITGGEVAGEPFVFDGEKNIPDSSWLRGPHDLRDEKLETHTFSFEQKISDKMYLDLGYNKQRTAFGHRGASSADGLEIQWDLNATLPDGSINPNAGRLFLESSVQNRRRELTRETYRALLSYDLDLEENNKWAGHHRFAALYETAEASVYNSRDKLVVSDNQLAGFNAANADHGLNTVYIRSYLDFSDPSSLVYDGPIEPFAEMPLSYHLPNNNNSRLNSDVGAPLPNLGTRWSQTPNAEKITTDEIDSAMIVMQNYWFNNRFITGYGVRKETLDNKLVTGDDTTRAPNDGSLLLDLVTFNTFENYSRSTSAVWHLNKAGNFSLFYNQGSNFRTPRPEHNIVGLGLAPVSRGESEDLGIKFDLFEGKFSGSLVKYETSGRNRSENTNTINTNNLFDHLANQNESLDPILADGVETPEEQMDREAANAARAAIATNIFGSPTGRFVDQSGTVLTDESARSSYIVNNAVVFDEDSEGYEINLTANPTKSLRIFANYSYSKTQGSSGGDEMIAYLNTVMPYFEGLIDDSVSLETQINLIENPDDPLDPATHEFEIYDLLQDSQRRLYDGFFSRVGSDIRGQNREKANLRANYSWSEGFLKGWSLGGGAQWRSPAVIGQIYEGENGFTLDGDDPGSTIQASEFKSFQSQQPFQLSSRIPIFGADQMSYSLNFGYKTKIKLGDRKANLSFQVNIDNLFDDRDPLVTQVRQISGLIYDSQYRFQRPRQVNLTTTLKF